MMRMNFFVLSLLLMLTLSGCIRKIHIERDFSNLKTAVREHVGAEISRDIATVSTMDLVNMVDGAGLTRENAVRIALMNNPGLRADFEMLGVAKADLVQAGLYTNPTVSSAFRFPTRDQGEGTAQTNIETNASFRLSDLWQVPLSKAVSEDLLEIVSLRILNSIVALIADTKMAYDQCLALRELVRLSRELVVWNGELRDEIRYRQSYGYTNDLDILSADIHVKKAEILYGKYRVESHNAYEHLKRVMGFSPSHNLLNLTGSLENEIPLPLCNDLEIYALRMRPDVLIAQVKMNRYKHELALEKSRIVNNIELGVSYSQDFDKPLRGIGPYVNIELPIFDSNYAQIARAEFFYNQAQKELQSIELQVQHEVRARYALLRSEMEGAIYHKHSIMPQYRKTADRAHIYADMMQLPMTTAIESTIRMLESELDLIDHWHRVRNEYTLLEKEVGAKLNDNVM